MPVAPDTPSIRYGAGVAIYTEMPRGPVYGHGGWIPGCASSLCYYVDHGVTVAFQINTDKGPSTTVPTLSRRCRGRWPSWRSP
ncbi:hypothetical protein [Rhodovulum sp. ES.010]|uniref:hypothetical protein n=1 Tax=Rhodovulum sp. ES.010 TaxID=1882821 RepID=UPI001115157E|nr:hypothetical protein [Rhodovulum sp. ES.010]